MNPSEMIPQTKLDKPRQSSGLPPVLSVLRGHFTRANIVRVYHWFYRDINHSRRARRREFPT